MNTDNRSKWQKERGLWLVKYSVVMNEIQNLLNMEKEKTAMQLFIDRLNEGIKTAESTIKGMETRKSTRTKLYHQLNTLLATLNAHKDICEKLRDNEEKDQRDIRDRRIIDLAWGYAYEDMQVPSTITQNYILELYNEKYGKNS